MFENASKFQLLQSHLVEENNKTRAGNCGNLSTYDFTDTFEIEELSI